MPRVVVVGGSLGGLTAALLLRDIGCEVDVYERASAPLSGFGAGIVVQPESARYLVERTNITPEKISTPSSSIRYFDAERGSVIDELHIPARYTSYNALYRGLLQSFGRQRYHLGHALVGIAQDGEWVELRFAAGAVVRCELAVCADGAFSTARHRLFGVAPKYAGYISWRGLADRELLSPETWSFFEDRFTYGLLPDSHTIAYPIPIVDDDLRVTGTQVNFQWYWNVPEGPELDEMMSGRDGLRRPSSVYADDMIERYVQLLHRRAREEIAVEPLVELMTRVRRPFLTLIADTGTPQMVVGRICLIGDAAITARPHGGAGGAKAAANAWALAEALVAWQGDVEAALRAWEPDQLQQGYTYLAKVRHMARLLQHGGVVNPRDPALRWGLSPVVSTRENLESNVEAT
jgi:2,6-dihydroxypyridine 3-monooxygenase